MGHGEIIWFYMDSTNGAYIIIAIIHIYGFRCIYGGHYIAWDMERWVWCMLK